MRNVFASCFEMLFGALFHTLTDNSVRFCAIWLFWGALSVDNFAQVAVNNAFERLQINKASEIKNLFLVLINLCI